MVCINDVLYYGNDDLNNTKQHQGCEYIPNGKKTKFHQLYIDKSIFECIIEDKQINYDNSKKSYHKFIMTSDAHEEGYFMA